MTTLSLNETSEIDLKIKSITKDNIHFVWVGQILTTILGSTFNIIEKTYTTI